MAEKQRYNTHSDLRPSFTKVERVWLGQNFPPIVKEVLPQQAGEDVGAYNDRLSYYQGVAVKAESVEPVREIRLGQERRLVVRRLEQILYQTATGPIDLTAGEIADIRKAPGQDKK